jgi:short-subunit dehydrogenase
MQRNKTAVVTAGSRGIGRAVVLRFLEEGFDVITCSRSKNKLEALKSDASGLETAGSLSFIASDLSGENGVDSFLNFVDEQVSEVDVLVNNAGAFVPGKVSEEPPGVLESLIDINLYSAYRVTRGLLPGMISHNHGHIFNMCSVASIQPYENGGSYCIAKYALMGFTRVLREEMKENAIRVTAVLPGATLSDSWEGVDLPEERFMPVEDIASCIYHAYSLSPRSVVEDIVIRPQLGDI